MSPTPPDPGRAKSWIAAVIVWLAVAYGLVAAPPPEAVRLAAATTFACP